MANGVLDAVLGRMQHQVIDCGPGWHRILTDLDAELAVLDPRYRIVRVKEKFGGLVVIASSDLHPVAESAFADRIQAAEHRSWRTCELCGQPGILHETCRPGAGARWVKTLCTPCAAGHHRQWLPVP